MDGMKMTRYDVTAWHSVRRDYKCKYYQRRPSMIKYCRALGEEGYRFSWIRYNLELDTFVIEFRTNDLGYISTPGYQKYIGPNECFHNNNWYQ